MSPISNTQFKEIQASTKPMQQIVLLKSKQELKTKSMANSNMNVVNSKENEIDRQKVLKIINDLQLLFLRRF